MIETGAQDGERGLELVRGIRREAAGGIVGSLQAVERAIDHLTEIRDFILAGRNGKALVEIAGGDALRRRGDRSDGCDRTPS